ncbi:MAG: 6-bladed beta-propeller [Prevotellaceae bacterium]|jgi:hypothetical protein|nr:6-bladed beta-propeller [Prevotellaceae bacterium]
MKKISIYIAVTLLLISCKTKEKNPVTSQILASESFRLRQDLPVEIIDAHDFESLPLEDINTKIKDIRYIPFFSKEPIGIFDKLVIYDNHVIVLDAFKSESIYIFDISGKLIHIIHSKGGGPEEYHGLMDITISRKDTLIVIPDRLSLSMLYYSLNGQFVKKTKAAPCFYLEMLGDKFVNQTTFAQSYSLDIEHNYNLIISSIDSVICKGFPYYPIQKEAIISNALQYNYKEQLLFTPVLSDTIYQIINDSTYSAKYVVNQKKSLWEKRKEYLTMQQVFNLIQHSNYTHLKPPILETKGFVSYQIAHEKNNMIASTTYWFDKARNKSFTPKEIPIDNKINIPNIIPRPMTIYNNHYVGIYLPHEVEEMITLSKNNMASFENEELRNILKDKKNKSMEFLMVMYEFW